MVPPISGDLVFQVGDHIIYPMQGAGVIEAMEEKEILGKKQHCYVREMQSNRWQAPLRPNVVLFGEMLPEESWSASLSHIHKSDLVIVIGTSLEVYPASQLPQMTEGKTVYINTEMNGKNQDFSLIIQDKAGNVLAKVNKIIEKKEK